MKAVKTARPIPDFSSPLHGRVRRLMSATVLAALAIFALNAQAHFPQRGADGGLASQALAGGMTQAQPERLKKMMDRMLDRVEASEAQRAQIRQIVQSAAPDVSAQRKAARELRQEGMRLLMAPAIDAAAAEQVRQKMLRQQDQSSQRTLALMLDISNVLTPAQRAKWVESMNRRSHTTRDGAHPMHGGRPKS